MPICHRPSCRLSQTELQSPHEARRPRTPDSPPPMADKFSIQFADGTVPLSSLTLQQAVWVRTKIERMMALPFDVLESIVQRLIPHPEPMTVNAVIALARARAVCQDLKTMVAGCSSTLQEREGVTTWEALAIAVALKQAEIENDGGIRIGFQFASMELADEVPHLPDRRRFQVRGSRERISVFAAILNRHRRATAKIHAHTGPTCPSSIAFRYSAERAEVVARE